MRNAPFSYRDGLLHAEDVSLTDIARAVGTPFFCYSQSAVLARYRAYTEAFADCDALICYALKANGNQAIVAALAQAGAGADIVSIGEMQRALAAGVPPERIVFSGVGKTAREMATALETGILQFNVESEPELRALSAVAAGRNAMVDIGIRINPDVDARTHAKISTGMKENKFGIAWDRAREIYATARDLPGLNPVSITMHIGSQLTQLAPYEAAFRRLADLVPMLRDDGHRISRLDMGGGIGIAYEDGETIDIADYADVVKRTVGGFGCHLLFEPGRVIVGEAGVLVARVIYVKQEGRRFIILDAAMNDLIRPTLYDAWHDIAPVREAAGAALSPADIVGPVCESGDIFAAQRPMPPVDADDLIAIHAVGAYASVMSSTYNARPLASEVLVNGRDYAVVRPRQTVEQLIALDRLPAWLTRDRAGAAD